MAVEVFSVAVFFVVLRETIEAGIIVSVLLAFLKQTLSGPERNDAVYKAMVKQVWIGTALGVFLCLVIGGAIIGTFYRAGTNVWQSAEYYYEGTFYLVASLIINVTGAALLRVGKMQDKWRLKVAKTMVAPTEGGARRSSFGKVVGKYALLILAFITVFREGIEGIAFGAGVTFSAPATSVPLPVVVGLAVGSFVGWILYKGASMARLQIFLVVSTCFLYLVAAGLFARPELNGGHGWDIFNGILGWTNSATYSTAISYNTYWIAVMLSFFAMRYQEVKGHWPLMRAKMPVGSSASETA